MATPAPEGSSASAEGVKRSADAPPAGESPAKAVKTEPTEKKEEVKEEEKDIKAEKQEPKEGVKAEPADEKKEKKAENGDDKKEKKEKKDKSEKKEKKEKKDDAGVKKEQGKETGRAGHELDHRKLFKEGQKFLTPPMADSTRAFYESLLQENPDSKIAIKFNVEYGLLPLDEHTRLLKRYMHLKEKGAFDVRAQIKRALEKKEKSGDKDKKDKKEKKEKKRKAESEPTDGAPDTPGAEAAATPAGDSQAAAAADPFFADFGEVQEEEELFGTDIFNDVFTKAFAEDEQPGSAPRDAVGTPRDFQTPAAELPVVQALPPRKKLKETKSKVEETSKTDQRSLCDKWTEVMDAIKRAPQLSIHEKDSIPYVQGFVQEMIAAAQQDEEDFQEGKPMLHKLRMLPKAVEVMKKYAFMEIFVTFQGCRALALWLKTLPSGELPSVHIRTALLECMMRLPITKEALQQSKDAPLGQVLAKLSQNPRETVGNRKAAAELVQKWLKQVLAKKPTASFDLDTFGEDEQPQGTLIRPPPETAETLRALEEESLTRNHPKVPIIAGKEYAVMPLPKHQPVRREKKDGESNRTKLAGVLQIMARPNKKSWKPYAPEVAGGKLNMM